MFRKKKRLQGIELISEVSGRFLTIIDELDTGIHDCQDEQANISEQISSLTQRDSVLAASVIRADALVKNLKNLLA